MTSKTGAAQAAAMRHGYRSGLEELIGEELTSHGVSFSFEQFAIEYIQPARRASYTPDFYLLDNGIIVETKGRFVTADRQKHLLIRDQHPGIDIRFVFSNPHARISKQSKTTYAMWCDKHNFQYAKAATAAQRRKGAVSVPQAWVEEPYCQERINALKAAIKESKRKEKK